MLGFVAFVALLLPLSAALPSKAVEIATKEKAAGMIGRVQDKFERRSPDVVTANTEVTFNDRDFYSCICNLDGVSLARGTPPVFESKEFASREDGIQLNREMIEFVHRKCSGPVDDRWPNPIDKVIEAKTCDWEAWGDYLVGVGVFRS
jgi:hypothetical protein